MSAATSLGYSYQRFKWPLQSLPLSSFSSQARCFGLRVLILGDAAVSSGIGSFLETVITEESLQSIAGVAQPCADAAGKFKLEKGVCGTPEFRAVAVPPRLFPARQTVHVDIFHLHHFEQSSPAMR